MRGFSAILRRELAGLFLSPLAWSLFFLTVLFNGLVLNHGLEREAAGDVDGALSLILGGGLPFWILSALLAPLLTMRMVSEESRSGLLEFLLTAPVSDLAVVLGKLVAATAFFALLWGIVWPYGLALQLLGAAPDWGIVLTSWLGAVLVCLLFSAVGLAASALSETPLVAAFLASVTNLALFWGPRLAQGARGRSDVLDGLLETIDVQAAYQGSFLTGALDSTHVLFFVAWSAAFFFLAVRLVEARRWL